MKSYILMLITAASLPLYAGQFYYPLRTGTLWQFQGQPLAGYTPPAPKEVMGDSLMANGRRYALIRFDDGTTIDYQRTSGDSVFQYDIRAGKELLFFRFNASEKETIATSIRGLDTTDTILIDTAEQPFFGRTRRFFRFLIDHRHVVDDERTITVADSFGVIRIVIGFGYVSSLSGAFVEGTTYGPIRLPSMPYYPLRIGNEWIYNADGLSKRKVIADTMFANGYRYSVLDHEDHVRGQYIRVDSHFVYYYDQYQNRESPVFQLDETAIGKVRTFPMFRNFDRSWILSIDTVSMFGERTRIIRYRLDGIIQRDYSLSDKFGLVQAKSYAEPPAPWPESVADATGCIINGHQYGTILSVAGRKPEQPEGWMLEQNYPNPFNPSTTIAFTLPIHSYVSVVIYDLQGKVAVRLLEEEREAGRHAVQWNAARYTSGVYYCRMQAGAYSETRKLVLVK